MTQSAAAESKLLRIILSHLWGWLDVNISHDNLSLHVASPDAPELYTWLLTEAAYQIYAGFKRQK